MNTASQNLPHHVAILRERLLHATDYERAVHYFLEEFAGDAAFVKSGIDDQPDHLLVVLRHVAAKLLGSPTELETARVMHLPELGFYHGSAIMQNHALLFFYLQDADTGVMAMIPGRTGGMEVARFRLQGGLADPRNN